MRIAHVSDYYLPRIGGIELHVHDLASRQRAAGHDVEVITPARPGDCMDTVPELADAMTVHRVGRTTRRLPLALHAARPGCDAVRRGGYDVVHVHASVVSPLAVAAASAASRAGIPSVVTVHSMWDSLATAFRLLERPTGWSRWPVVWSAVSEAAAQPIRRIVDTEVAVLPNGVDPAAWRVEPRERDCNEVVVVSVMRLASRKRPLQLLRMMRKARRLLPPDVRLQAVIIGEGPERRLLERYLRRHDLAASVSLPGLLRREEIREVFGRADFFVAPANLESFGIAALEARCAGLPVVAKAHSGICEFIVDGRDGLLVRTDAEMVQAIARLAGSPQIRASMTDHSRAVPTSSSWAEVLRQNEAAYARAAALLARQTATVATLHPPWSLPHPRATAPPSLPPIRDESTTVA